MDGPSQSRTGNPVIGILTLGQTPRPDFVAVVRSILPHATVYIRGGFDGLSRAAIEEYRAGPQAAYALMVRLADGSTINVDKSRLLPNLTGQAALLAQDGAGHIVLMCSGGFEEFDSPVPVIRPVALLQAYAGILAARKRIGIVSPIQAQTGAAASHWQGLGYTVFSDFASPFEPDAVCRAAARLESEDVDVIMLDCMGFTHDILARARNTVSVPVLLPVALIRAFFETVYGKP